MIITGFGAVEFEEKGNKLINGWSVDNEVWIK